MPDVSNADPAADKPDWRYRLRPINVTMEAAWTGEMTWDQALEYTASCMNVRLTDAPTREMILRKNFTLEQIGYRNGAEVHRAIVPKRYVSAHKVEFDQALQAEINRRAELDVNARAIELATNRKRETGEDSLDPAIREQDAYYGRGTQTEVTPVDAEEPASLKM